VRYHAIGALARLRPDDASITAALVDASAVEHHDTSFALAQRPVAHLRSHVPALLAQLHSGRTGIARVLGTLGDTAPPEVALALGHELAAGRPYVVLVDALDALGAAALPALPAVLAAAHDLDDESAREAAAQLAVKLRRH
jgi:hypothetical protein